MTKFTAGLIVTFLIGSTMHAETITQKIGNDFYTLDTDDDSFCVTPIPIRQTDDEYPYVSSVFIDDFTIARLARNEIGNDYRYTISDYETGSVLNEYHFYYKFSGWYTLTKFCSIDSIYFIQEDNNWANLKKISMDGSLLFSKVLYDISSVSKLLIDETNEVAIFESNSDQEKNRICIISLKDSFALKEYYGKLLYKMSQDSHKLYFSDEDTIYCVDYQNGFNTEEINVDKKKREEIVELVNFGNGKYILVTKKNYWEFFAVEIFGTQPYKNYYYFCSLKEDTLEINKLINTGKYPH